MSDSFEIYTESIIKTKRGKILRVVDSIHVTSDGNTEVCSYECYFDKDGKVKNDYETWSECKLDNIYQHYDLVGEDGKLFN